MTMHQAHFVGNIHPFSFKMKQAGSLHNNMHSSIPTSHSLHRLILKEIDMDQLRHRSPPTERVYENILVRVLLHSADVTPLMGSLYAEEHPELADPTQDLTQQELMNWLCLPNTKQALCTLIHQLHKGSTPEKKERKKSIDGSARTGYTTKPQEEEEGFEVLNLVEKKDIFSPQQDLMLFTPEQLKQQLQNDLNKKVKVAIHEVSTPHYQSSIQSQSCHQPPKHPSPLWLTAEELPAENQEHFVDQTEYFGHFLYGDAPTGFKAYLDEGQLMFVVQWKPRKDGFQPAPSLLAQSTVTRHVPNQVVSFLGELVEAGM